MCARNRGFREALAAASNAYESLFDSAGCLEMDAAGYRNALKDLYVALVTDDSSDADEARLMAALAEAKLVLGDDVPALPSKDQS
jgi:hypothetical protein